MIALAGLPAETQMDGDSLVPLLKRKGDDEWNFSATPTTSAIRDQRYKYAYYHGIWDRNGFCDLQSDPLEQHNLIDLPQYQDLINEKHTRLFDELAESGGLKMPIRRPAGEQYHDRKLRR